MNTQSSSENSIPKRSLSLFDDLGQWLFLLNQGYLVAASGEGFELTFSRLQLQHPAGELSNAEGSEVDGLLNLQRKALLLSGKSAQQVTGEVVEGLEV